MKARAVSIVTAAGLAVVVFVIGALGSRIAGGLRGRARQDSRRGASGDAFLAPTSAAGSLDAAIASLESRLDAAPDDWQASAALGIAYVQQARVTADPSAYPVAEAALRRSLALEPTGNADALVGLGTLAAARHDFAAALRWGRRAVRTAPFDADAYGLLGDAQVELGRYRAAFASFQRMVDTRPDLASYARVSYALELRGNVAGAIDAMRAAADVAARPADAAWAAAQVGKLHLGAGRIDEAEAWFRRAQAADPRSMEAEAGLALVAWASGDTRSGDRRLRATRHAVPVAGARRHPRGPLRGRRRDRGGRGTVRPRPGRGAALPGERREHRPRDRAVRGGSPGRGLGAGGAPRRPRRVGPPHERPRSGRPGLGPVRERPLPGGRGRLGAGTAPRHTERAVPVPCGDDQAPPRGPKWPPRRCCARPRR